MKHTLFHHLAMVVTSEVVNLIWLVVAFVIMIAGYAIFANLPQPFFKVAVGLPVALLGICVFLFKIHELILTLADTQRLKAICKFCFSEDEE